MLERAIKLVGAHCDLERRVRDVPPAAKVRGVWMRSAEIELELAGKLAEYEAIAGGRTSSLRWYSLGEGLARHAVAAALIESPERVHEGLRRLGRANSLHFSESLLGRTLIKLLSPDPKRVLEQAAAARRQTCNYGRWEFEFPEPGRALVWHREEYAWIESLILGSAEGTFAAIRVPAQFEVRLEGPYDGVIDIRW